MSTAVATKTYYTPDELLAMPDGKSYELVGGQLLERHMGIESSWVGGRLFARLERYCEEHQSGWVLQADSGYQCFPHDPGQVRKPDRYEYLSTMTVLQAIKAAGDFTDYAKKTVVEVTRANGTKIIVNCKKAQKNPRLDIPIYPGDSIYVPVRFW